MAAVGRPFDVVIWGATSFTGKLATRYLAGRPGVAIAGRASSRQRLADLREKVLREIPGGGQELVDRSEVLPILVADLASEESLLDMASQARVVLTFAGPYAQLGMPLANACVEAGTDYCDITGESNFQRELVDGCHDAAKSSGVRLVTSCGYDSVPFDLGALACVEKLREQGLSPGDVVAAIGNSRGGVSGGTIASGMGIARARQGGNARTRAVIDSPLGIRGDFDEAAAAPDPNAGVECLRSLKPDAFCAPSVMASANSKIVYRSMELMPDVYGATASYKEGTMVGSQRAAKLGYWALAAVGGLLGLPVLPNVLRTLRVLPSPGQGPSEATREQGFFNVHFAGWGEGSDKPAAVARVESRYGDPGYKSTAAMASECALMLAEGKAREGAAGVLTPASCFGMALGERLEAAGVLQVRAEIASEDGANFPLPSAWAVPASSAKATVEQSAQ